MLRFRHMRKWSCLVLGISVFLVGCSGANPNDISLSTEETPSVESIYMIPDKQFTLDVGARKNEEANNNIAADSRDRLYLAGGDAIYIFAPDGNEAGRIEGLNACHRIAAGGERLYALDKEGTGRYLLRIYDTETQDCVQTYTLRIHDSVSFVSLVGEYLILVAHDEEHYSQGYRIDLHTGEMVDCEYAALAEWSVLTEKGILWGSSPMMLQSDWDAQPASLAMGSFTLRGCGMQDDMNVYTGTGSTVGRVDWEESSIVSCGLAESEILFMAGGSNMIYTYNVDDTISCIPESVLLSEPTQTLHLLLSMEPINYFLYCIQDYMRENPGIRIEYKTMDSWSIKPKLLAGADDIDIFAMDTIYAETHAYHRAGALEDLSQYDAIREIMEDDRLIEGALQSLTIDGALVALPEYFATSVFMLNEGNFEKAGLTMPEPSWTWQDFFTLMLDADGDSDGDGKNDGLPFMTGGFYASNWPLYMDDYIVNYYDAEGRTVCFDTEVFRELMPMWKEFAKLDWAFESLDGVQYTWGCMKMTNMNVNRFLWDISSLKRYTYISAPRIVSPKGENLRSVGDSSYLLGVYSRSENKELAADFLAYMADYDRKHAYALSYDYAILYEVNSMEDYTKTADAYYDSDEEEQFFFERGYPVYRETLAQTVLPIIAQEEKSSFAEHISLYMIDVITLDELIARLTETAEMMLR